MKRFLSCALIFALLLSSLTAVSEQMPVAGANDILQTEPSAGAGDTEFSVETDNDSTPETPSDETTNNSALEATSVESDNDSTPETPSDETTSDSALEATSVESDSGASLAETPSEPVEEESAVEIAPESTAEEPSTESACEMPSEEIPSETISESAAEESPAELAPESAMEGSPAETTSETPSQELSTQTGSEPAAEESPAESEPSAEEPSDEASSEMPSQGLSTETSAESVEEESPDETACEIPSEAISTEPNSEPTEDNSSDDTNSDVPSAEAPSDPSAEESSADTTGEDEQPTSPDNHKIISSTQTVENEVWQQVVLVRDENYEGSLAYVRGELVLDGVTLENGELTSDLLGDLFTLAPNSSVTIVSDHPLLLSASAICVDRATSKTLTLTYNGASVPAAQIKWASSDAAIVSVASGRVSAKKAGKATVTATYNGETASCVVYVLTPVQTVAFSKTQYAVDCGATIVLTPSVKPASAGDQTLVFKTSNPAIATVDENGAVTGIAPGTVTISAVSASGPKGTTKVKVSRPADGVELPQTLTIYAGKTSRLTASVLPADTSNKKITWTTSDKKVATVEANGTVRGVAGGVCTITATTHNGLSAQCQVTVKQAVTLVKFAKAQYSLDTQQTITLVPTVSPATASDKTVTYSSSNPAIATVDENGAVTGIAPGTVTISAVSASGPKGTTKVKVSRPADGVELPQTLTVYAGKTSRLTASVLPADTSNKKITWTTSDKKVATVETNGTVRGVAGGVCTITATTHNGLSAQCQVTVKQAVTSVKLDKAAYTVERGSQLALRATILPATASDLSLRWEVNQPEVASVDENGIVTGVAAGTAKVTVYAADGKTASATITVTQPVESLSIPAELTLDARRTFKITSDILPENATNKKITWSSSNPKVASVSAAGVVTGVSRGECVITATAHNGVQSACAVTILQPVTSVAMNRTTATVSLGSTLALSAVVVPTNASFPALTWTSSDSNVATVDENGLITAISGGAVTITAASANGPKATCRLTVKEIKPTRIALGTSFLTLNPGQEVRIETSIAPADVSIPTILFTSSDPAIATVDENGLVTAVDYGRATITCAAKSQPSVKRTVTVSVVSADSLRLDGVVIGINPGHQTRTIYQQYPIAPNSSVKALGCKVGASGTATHIPEYVTNRQISLKLYDLLEEAGATVVITRTTDDVYLNNIERANILNEAGVDLALQVHCDSGSYEPTEGLTVFYNTLDEWVDENRQAARILSEQMSAATDAVNRGYKVCNTYMSLNWTTTPSVLLEMGYLSNRKEDALLNSDSYQNLMAQGIFEGLCQYFGR